MVRSISFPMILSVLFAGLAAGAPAPKPDARKDLERLAEKLQFFSAGDFVYDRTDLRHFPEKEAKKYRQAMRELTETRYEVAALVALLKHENPKVRTLAMAALFAREDPKLLPHFVSLATDKAATFPAPSPFARAAFGPKEVPPLEPRTVGQCASMFVEFYSQRASHSGGAGGFDAYWGPRKNRAFCASWFAVLLDRATQGTSPLPKDREEKVRAVRRRIDALPEAYRAWTLLWLNADRPHDALVTEDELVAMCKELGRDRLLQMLQRKATSDDPDLDPVKGNNYRHRQMCVFVLRHAKVLLRPEDTDTLLECERGEADELPAWVVAAAELQPNKAKELLNDAFKRFRGEHQGRARAELALALWRFVGPRESKFLVGWLYDEKPERGAFPHAKAAFLREFAEYRKVDVPKLLATLIADKRFEIGRAHV